MKHPKKTCKPEQHPTFRNGNFIKKNSSTNYTKNQKRPANKMHRLKNRNRKNSKNKWNANYSKNISTKISQSAYQASKTQIISSPNCSMNKSNKQITLTMY